MVGSAIFVLVIEDGGRYAGGCGYNAVIVRARIISHLVLGNSIGNHTPTGLEQLAYINFYMCLTLRLSTLRGSGRFLVVFAHSLRNTSDERGVLGLTLGNDHGGLRGAQSRWISYCLIF